ncbi:MULTISPECIES: imelysin family protein [unclassified Spirosoma]|uniref:imelysin family protein n=1 Tax=unclassified Spirosoma TaxID=2621999 RepID=UPI00096442ED|nr:MULTISPECIES: imelysin family protein [unclassified Spirosoma]MBN8822241.1 imelysin family protein [Spirosoma sp.]OJW72446.1 MAG: peptidase M75, Imelysin [Spirosoma sp. 48-14]
MKQVRWKQIGSACILFGMLWACSGGGTDTPMPTNPTNQADSDRKAMLTNIADNIIVPAYANFKTKMDAMTTKSDAFAAKPDKASLADFRQAWVDAYTEWQKVELFDVGPAEQYTLRNFFNIYPANTTGIEEYIAAGSGSFDVPLSYPKQGFPALDYLINGLGSTDDAIVARYTTATDAAKRIAYLKRLTTQMNSVFSTVYTQWTTGGYRDTFINCTALNAGCSTGKLVNGYVLNYERYIRSGKIGIPSGAMTNGTVSPDKVEAYYKKDLALTLAKTAHQASVDFFNGKSVKTGQEGPGLKSYLNSLGAKDSQTGKSLVDIVNAQFDLVNQKLSVLKANLSDEVKTNNTAVTQVYTEMQKAVRMLKVDMTSAMSITITYTDNDGD